MSNKENIIKQIENHPKCKKYPKFKEFVMKFWEDPDSVREILEEVDPDFTFKEQSYRRGYCHGFLAARRNPELTWQIIYAWRNGEDETSPPGSVFSDIFMDGLRVNCEDEFFIDKIKKKRNSN